MSKRTLKDLTDLKGQRVLVRVDFNVPQDDQGNISNDRRIRAALPTLQHILDTGASAVVMSHLGRPKGDAKKDNVFRMDKVAARLQELLGKPVKKVDEVVGSAATAAAEALKPGEVLLLENVRFHPGEQKGDPELAKELAALGDVYVNDAFGTCHRADVSMAGCPAAMAGKPRVVGFLVAKELDILGKLLANPDRPALSILGGAKVSDKIGFIKALLERVDAILVGGAMSYTFLKAQGRSVGGSKLEADKLDLARELLDLGKDKIILPMDHVVVQAIDQPQSAKVVEGDISDGWIGVDIGHKTVKAYKEQIAKAKTAVWNGPLGLFEMAPYSWGTRAVAEALANAKAVTIVGGGETAEAVEELGLAEKMTHVSTGGGAFLEFVEGKPFPGLEHIDEK